MSEVIAVNISGGGIPKLPVPVGRVVEGGLEGDAHDHDKHNTPMQAISIISDEVLDALRDEGFDVGPGATGENVTVRGFDVDGLEPGDRLHFSGGVLLEVTKKRGPCFVLDQIHADLRDAARGRLGAYAKVIAGGELRPGETLELA